MLLKDNTRTNTSSQTRAHSHTKMNWLVIRTAASCSFTAATQPRSSAPLSLLQKLSGVRDLPPEQSKDLLHPCTVV